MSESRTPEARPRPIRPFDLAFLVAETHAEPLHVGALLVFDAPPSGAGWTPAGLVAAYRASALVAPFNRLAEFPLLGAPRWRQCERPDMRYHVQHLRLPAPGGERELCELVQEMHSSPLDRGQPLFRLYVIEGLADGGFALFAKTHHALVDGISGLMRIVASLSADARALPQPPFFAAMPSAGRRAPRATDRALARAAEALREQARAAGELSASALRKLGAALAGTPEANTLFVAPVTPINRPVHNGRALALLSLPLGALREIGHAAGGTINDVALAIVDAAVNRYLEDRHAGVQRPLVAMAPVSLRAKGDTQATTKATAMVAALGDPGATLPARLKQIVARVQAAKAEVRAMSDAAAMDNAIAMYALVVGLGSLGVEHPGVNLIVSNIPGPEGDLFLGGARLRGIYPANALSIRVGLNVTLVSQGGQMHMGFVSDRSQLQDPERVAALSDEAFGQLARAAARRSKGTSAPRKDKRAAGRRRTVSRKGD